MPDRKFVILSEDNTFCGIVCRELARKIIGCWQTIYEDRDLMIIKHNLPTRMIKQMLKSEDKDND